MAGLFAFFLVEVVISKSLCNFRFVYNEETTAKKMNKSVKSPVKNLPKVSSQVKMYTSSSGPASKRVLPDLSTFCQTYFFLEIF
jgi:hypothetical protein